MANWQRLHDVALQLLELCFYVGSQVSRRAEGQPGVSRVSRVKVGERRLYSAKSLSDDRNCQGTIIAYRFGVK